MSRMRGIYVGIKNFRRQFLLFLWGGKTCRALIATPNVDNANKRQKKGKS
jgi:hypothetical protein